MYKMCKYVHYISIYVSKKTPQSAKTQGISQIPKKVCASHGAKRAGGNKPTIPESAEKMATECCEFGDVGNW